MEVVAVVLKYGFALVLLAEVVVIIHALVALAREKAAPPVTAPAGAEE